ncbi:ABC transporter permease [Rhodococcoides kyotonense]|uniref:Peptide/nickel transport system permease protein n=1 Tax=Rhodococcoides kyotonense TaxID=398843 RepID=A0A239GBS2_9NOCA|nr:ABC transporter permease [Rhodococcus kyotonensis]SNS66152.1 peptide/nickel transport system permease protein [Rhodococcus kyotonensis]
MTLADTVLDHEVTDVAEPDVTDSRVRPRAARRVPGLFLLRKPALVLSIALLLLMIGWALFPEVFTSHDPYVGVPKDKLQPPSAEYLFGTDHLGRDLYTRTVYGTALSMQATLIAVVVGLFAGSAIGLLSGFVGGKFDDVVMRFVDVLLSIPGLLLSLAVVSVLGFGTVNVAIAVGVASVASFARIMRSDVLRMRTQVFVEAATVSGVKGPEVLLRHILPHSLGSVLVLAALEFGAAILAVSALSFLGFGAPPPAPEWGSLVAEGRNYLATAWWLTTLPGVVIALSVLATNRISRALDDGKDRLI